MMMIKRIALVKPCCIGDVIMATALLAALHRAYPAAEIDWFVGSTAAPALRTHPDLHQIIDTGPRANPASRLPDLFHLVSRLRADHYDLLAVPDRSPLFSVMAGLSGIRQRAGLDSGGRGFGYNIKAKIDPQQVRHEADIYLDVARVLKIDIHDCWVNLPPSEAALQEANAVLKNHHLADQPYVMIHPGGAVNAGMTMLAKRWPADRFAALADQLADNLGAQIVLIGAETDRSVLTAFLEKVRHPVIDLTLQLSLMAIGALASLATLYVGNDNGVAHIAAASGGKVLMIFGPSDPRRYAPFVPPNRAQFAWREVPLPSSGVTAGTPVTFDWERDGVSVAEAWQACQPLLR